MKQTLPTIHVRVVSPAELRDDELNLWKQWLCGDDVLRSPCFHPEFTLAVAAVRNDVRIAVVEDADGLAAFFPFQRSRLGFGKPVGGRLCDFQGVVARPGFELTAGDLIRRAGLVAWDYTHVPATQSVFSAYHADVEPSGYLDVSRGFEAYVEERRQSGSKTIPKQQRKTRKLEREVGPLRFEPQQPDPRMLRTMMEWKSNQYRRTGIGDVFSFDWTVALLQRLHRIQTPEFRGKLSALYAGEKLIAVHFGMQTDTVLHYWFPVYDPAFQEYSPGIALLLEIARDAAESGIRRIDLGKGTEDFKISMRTAAFDVAAGSVGGGGMIGGVRQCWSQTRNWLKSSPLGAPARASARLVRPWREWLSFR
jgi:CelD/BcsL family acetyltransferase involved in cellulose biosynthesis